MKILQDIWNWFVKPKRLPRVGDKFILASDKGNPFVDYYYEVDDVQDGWVLYHYRKSCFWGDPQSDTVKTIQRVYTLKPRLKSLDKPYPSGVLLTQDK
jgi:hypothetical protein